MPPTQTYLGLLSTQDGTIFHSWALLGRILHYLLRLLLLLVVLNASWTTPGSILEGLGRFRAWLFRLQGLIF